jgi:hypothetical protein
LKRRPTLERILPENLDTRRLVLLGAGLFLGSAVVTLIILLAGSGGGGRAQREVPPTEALSSVQKGADIGVADLILPDEVGRVSGEPSPAGPPYLLRPPRSRWTEEQIKRYWVPLEQIAVDRIREENDRRIEELFEGVP